MRMALAAILLLSIAWPLPGRAQEGTSEGKLEEVLQLMEKRAEGLRDLTFRIGNRTERNTGIPRADVSVVYVRGTGLRVRIRHEWGKEARAGVMTTPSMADYIYTPDRIRLIQEWDDRPNVGPVTFLALAVRTDDPAFRSQDHVLLPSGTYPIRLMYDEPLVYYQIAPRQFFALEPNLLYEGQRTEGSKTYHVLASSPAPRDPKLPQSSYSVEGRRKQFFVDPATGALARLRWDLSFKWRSGANSSEQRMTFVIEPSGEQKVTETLALPESVRWTQAVDGRNVGRGNDLHRTITALRANTGRAPSEILSDEEKEDLYGEAVMRGVDEYEARVKRDPQDAEAQYALVQARGWDDPMAQMMRGRPAEKADPGPIVAALEKAAELRPKAEGPAINLLSAHRAAGDTAREKEYLARLEKSGPAGPRIRLRAAARLNALGEVDRAATLLEGFAPSSEEDRRRAALERLFVAAAKGDSGRLAGLFAEEATRRPGTADKFALVRSIETRLEGLPEAVRTKWTAESTASLVEKGIQEHPAELAFRIARAALLLGQGKSAASAAELLEAAPGDAELVDRALDQLDPVDRSGRIVIGGAAPEAPPADTEGLPRLLTAFEKVARGDPRLDYQWGKALTASGKADEAGKKFEAALESCRAQAAGKPHHSAAMRVAFQLGAEKPSDGWRDRCVEVILAIGKDSASIPFDLMYDESRNPIAQAVGDLFARKEWVKAYRIAVAAQRMAGGNYFLWRHRDTLKEEGIAAIKKEVYQEQAPEKFVELADFLEGFRGGQDVAEVLEKAVEKLPQDLDLLERLARKHAQLGRALMAESAFDKLVPKVAADRRPGLLLELAQVFVNAKDAGKARQVLGRIDLKALDGATAVRCAALWIQAEDWDRAIETCRRAYELGQKPHFLMGKSHEKKQDYYEALRYYNRDAAEGSSAGNNEGSAVVRPRFRSSGEPEEGEPATGKAARAKLLKKVGPDWLLKRFLEQKIEPLGGEDEKKVKAFVEKLASDDVADRDGAFEELRKFGPRATPLLTPLLKSGDEEAKTRVRQLFNEWAEPK